MDYKARIAALRNFKSAVSAGSVFDGVSGLSVTVADWEGNAVTKFENYLKTVQKDAKKIAKRKKEFLSGIDDMISKIQAQFDLEYQTYALYLYMTYDEDAIENRSTKWRTINNLSIDNSVKRALLARV